MRLSICLVRLRESPPERGQLSGVCVLQVTTERSPLEETNKHAGLQAQVEVVKQTVGENISKAIGIGEAAQDLEEKTAMMADNSKAFHVDARTAKRQAMWKNWKLNAIIAGVVVLLLVILFNSWFSDDGE